MPLSIVPHIKTFCGSTKLDYVKAFRTKMTLTLKVQYDCGLVVCFFSLEAVYMFKYRYISSVGVIGRMLEY